jgi:membrane associated rhomboid family serine protease
LFGEKETVLIFGKMQSSRNLVEELKFQLQHGPMTNRLIIYNVGVFALIQLISGIISLSSSELVFVQNLPNNIFTLDTNFIGFIQKPWGIITSVFSHFSLWHLLFDLLFLYFSGQMFEQLFDKRRLWQTYIFGGITGGLLEILAHYTFPSFQNSEQIVVGASGSIMAIFTALAFHSPNIKVNLFGIIPVRIYFIAIFFLLNDLIGISNPQDNVAHFAHLGGAIFGMISIQSLHSKSNILSTLGRLSDSVKKAFQSNTSKNSSKKSFKTDEDYNLERKKRQEKTDAILDKISKSGYESLTKAEKDFLFNQSKNN